MIDRRPLAVFADFYRLVSFTLDRRASTRTCRFSSPATRGWCTSKNRRLICRRGGPTACRVHSLRHVPLGAPFSRWRLPRFDEIFQIKTYLKAAISDDIYCLVCGQGRWVTQVGQSLPTTIRVIAATESCTQFDKRCDKIEVLI